MELSSQLIIARSAYQKVVFVAGEVIDIHKVDDSTTAVTIQNDLPIALDGVRRSGVITATFPNKVIHNAKLKLWYRVVMAVKDEHIFDAIMNGDVCLKPYFVTKGYTLRYTGEFSYQPTDISRQRHVIVGNVVTKYEGVSKSCGERWAKYVVEFKSASETKVWDIMEYKTIHDVKKGKRYIFATGHVTQDRYDNRCSVVASQIFSL